MIIAENLIRSAGGLRQSSSVRANRLVVPSVPRHPKRLHLSLPSSGPNRHVCNVSAVLSGGSKVTSAHRGPKSSVAKAPSTRQKPEPKALYLGLGGAAALLGSFAFIASQLGPEAAHHVAQYTDAHGPTTLYDLLGACGQPSNSLHSVHATSSAAGHVFTPHHSTVVGAIPSHSNLRSGLAALQASVVPFSPDFISASCPYVSSPAAPAALSNIVHHAAQPAVSAAAASSTSSVQHFTSAVSAVGRTAGMKGWAMHDRHKSQALLLPDSVSTCFQCGIRAA